MNFLLLLYTHHHTAFAFAFLVTLIVLLYNESKRIHLKTLFVTSMVLALLVTLRSINLSTILIFFIIGELLYLHTKTPLVRIIISLFVCSIYTVDITLLRTITSPVVAHTGYLALLSLILPPLIYNTGKNILIKPFYSILLFALSYSYIILLFLSGIKHSAYTSLYTRQLVFVVAFSLIYTTLISIERNTSLYHLTFGRKKLTLLCEYLKKNASFYLNKNHLYALFFSSLAMLFVYPYIFIMGKLATHLASPYSIPDQLHTLIPKKDTSSIHLGAFNFFRDIAFFIVFFFAHKIPFYVTCLAVLTFTRSSFVALTNLGLPEGQPVISSAYTFGGDLFFSGHVAIPFMTALVFWDIKPMRYISLLATIIFGVAAVVGRFHYTIDVLAAPFITYGIFIIVKKLFPRLAVWAYKTEEK
ncbi:MAG: hypothetical protein RLZZ308_13 [Candidatus Parcubacteria bacterium]|jgi:hypothetical protein